ncbi:hypothetical protein BV394_02135 [Brevirhabdus pacifica]|uniref:Uncharacterized protein n=1 Tax=Brevirhabdus pacifica TaxID=1267768 RepID=A0A1U7DFM3_9RHOB|nr:hypothetical protein [Brevirhabdus pacifica]APX88678.1 hypothetical protein BV394_02135 [Brevirhabdus pacifica]OWU79943.1 hypothetical protein ATO5_02815 [Loktanella sp. 22II-4b]PJJ86817.1 hypothetical protein CLV77_1375 [Brevirhabdus pacifica]
MTPDHFANIAADPRHDLTVSEAAAIFEGMRDGDIHHIDGPFIRALDELAGAGYTEYAGCEITRSDGDTFTILADGRMTHEDSAVCALIMASNPSHNRRHWSALENAMAHLSGQPEEAA